VTDCTCAMQVATVSLVLVVAHSSAPTRSVRAGACCPGERAQEAIRASQSWRRGLISAAPCGHRRRPSVLPPRLQLCRFYAAARGEARRLVVACAAMVHVASPVV
jgi:hypothetical protein